METLNKYRVWIHIRGSVVRPAYDGYVEVYAENDNEAAERAKRELMRGTFKDVWYENFVVESVERQF